VEVPPPALEVYLLSSKAKLEPSPSTICHEEELPTMTVELSIVLDATAEEIKAVLSLISRS
jgi:hypothetical protein